MNRKLHIDWILVTLFGLLLLWGWLTIYAVSSANTELAFAATNHGRQLFWIVGSFVIGGVILSVDNRFVEAFAYFIYGGAMLLLLAVLLFGKEVNGAKSWLIIGSLSMQPSELAKVATVIALAKYMSAVNFNLANREHLIFSSGIVILPALITLLQNDTGSALVFGSLLIVFYREGLSPLIPAGLLLTAFVCLLTLGLGNQLWTTAILFALVAISFMILYSKKYLTRLLTLHGVAFLLMVGLSFSTSYIVSKLQPHQQIRMKVLFNPNIDPQGSGYNVIQSKIAIGSGGVLGKGFLNGNYTKYKFVPKQVTDFIFCTVGEEWGWLGSTLLIVIFAGLLFRIYQVSESTRVSFSRIYGYGIISIFFFHIFINIGMAIGLIPVIGIPLPFFSYGGSSLLAFSIMIFIFINLSSSKGSMLSK